MAAGSSVGAPGLTAGRVGPGEPPGVADTEWAERFGEGRLAYNDAGTGFGRLGIDAVALGVPISDRACQRAELTFWGAEMTALAPEEAWAAVACAALRLSPTK